MAPIEGASTFTVVSHKSIGGDPTKQWSNTYEFVRRGLEELTYADFSDLANAIANFESDFHLSITQVDRVVISTWNPDSVIGVSDNFIVFPFGPTKQGQRVKDGPDEYKPLTDTAYVTRNVVTGRSGKLYYRGCLTEAMVTAPNAGPEIFNIDNPNYTDFLADFISSVTDNIADYLLAGDAPFMMCMVNITGESTIVFRNVTGLSLLAPKSLRKDHRYFNRSSTIITP